MKHRDKYTGENKRHLEGVETISTTGETNQGVTYTAFEEEWESHSDLKVDQLVTTLLRKWPLNSLVPTGELFVDTLLSFSPHPNSDYFTLPSRAVSLFSSYPERW
jgi:hypothetical protein